MADHIEPPKRAKTIWRDIHGIIVLDKPVGLSSNTALQQVRHIFRARKAGHTGSLDPLASGLLPICLGEATKVAGFLLDAPKTYRACVALGAKTDTGDLEGAIIEKAPVPPLSHTHIEQCFNQFIGEQRQVPPMYSALKHHGQPLYQLARQGISIERAERIIEITRLELLNFSDQTIEFEVSCSKGTYVRTLGEDIATQLGTVGHLSYLRRIGIGRQQWRAFRLEDLEAHRGDEQTLDQWLLPTAAGVAEWFRLDLTADQAQALVYGLSVKGIDFKGHQRAQLWSNGRFLGLGEVGLEPHTLKSLRLMSTAQSSQP